MTKLFTFLLIALSLCAGAQDDALDKAGLLLSRCPFEPSAEVMIIRDEAKIAVNNDYSLRLERHVTYRCFKDKKLDRQFAENIFYPSPYFDKYYKLSVHTTELDATTKAPVHRELTGRITSTRPDQANIRIKAGALLDVVYAVNFPYNEKLPDWRFQSCYPTELSTLRVQAPQLIQMEEHLTGSYEADIHRSTASTQPIRLHNETQTVRVAEHYYELSQLPAITQEPFSDNSPLQQARMHFHISWIVKGADTIRNFAAGQVDRIVENLSTRMDFLLTLGPSLDIKSDYDRRIRSLTDRQEKMARIYDLVRRHIIWDHVDSLFARHSLNKIWTDKKGNSTEINLCLVKLLQVYGYEAAPLIISTRSHGVIDTAEVALSDFNRTVACVTMDGRHIGLDATGRYYDYPMMSASILNTRGLLISMDRDRWIEIRDTGSLYKNTVTLLGHLRGDTSFVTFVYVNSYGYSKPEHVQILEDDSVKGLRRYFEHGNKKMQLKHFIADNEYVDSLPLAQEFDVRVPLIRSDNLCGLVPTWFSIPDTLFSITDGRRSDINFGYRQEYDLVSEFTFPANYEIYLLPTNEQLSILGGRVRFEREYHAGATDFSMRQYLYIDQSYFNMQESVELSKFLKKIATLNAQQVMLKKD